ncbi:hypothetical protein LBMAG42_37440 [Deltaproteobacteria bacterium]|nr:hypothetical protein LBMAG42_37440 [Deltaproteobacteria bacterium]
MLGQGLNAQARTQERDLSVSDWLCQEMEDARVATGSDAAAMAVGGVLAIGAPLGWALDAMTDGESSGHTSETVNHRHR